MWTLYIVPTCYLSPNVNIVLWDVFLKNLKPVTQQRSKMKVTRCNSQLVFQIIIMITKTGGNVPLWPLAVCTEAFPC